MYLVNCTAIAESLLVLRFSVERLIAILRPLLQVGLIGCIRFTLFLHSKHR